MDLFGENIDKAKEDKEDIHMPSTTSEVSGLSHPRLMQECLGHDTTEASMLSMIVQDKLPHALIFSGVKGIGKATFAYRLARYLLHTGKSDLDQGGMFDDMPSETPNTMAVPPEARAVRLLAAGAHPDFLALERLEDDKGNVKAGLDVAQLRKITPFLRMTASEGGWRIVIVDDADTMNRNAQNAILKILEEPPANTLLILVTHRIGALVPTIRSRCRVIDFQPLETENLKSLLAKQGHCFAGEEFTTLKHLSGGSIGQALRLIDENGLEVLGKILTVLSDYPNWRESDIHLLAEEYARIGNAGTYELFAELMSWITDELARAKARGLQQAAQPLHLEVFGRILKNSSLDRLVKICENLQEHFGKVSRANLDKRQGVMEAFSIMRAA